MFKPEEDLIQIIEFEITRPEKPIAFIGLPDVGLVGVIAVSHMIENMGMKEIGYVDSEIFPPVIVFHNGNPKHPIRIYQKDCYLAVMTEIALPALTYPPLTKALTKWLYDKRVEMVFSLSGVGVPNRLDIEKPQVYGASTSPSVRDFLKSHNIPLFEEGFLVGPYALIAKYSQSLGLQNALLLAQAFPQYPDPGAAAAVIDVINRIYGLNIDTKALEERSEEIRIKARELMRRTYDTMRQMGKSQEYELPLMYA